MSDQVSTNVTRKEALIVSGLSAIFSSAVVRLQRNLWCKMSTETVRDVGELQEVGVATETLSHRRAPIVRVQGFVVVIRPVSIHACFPDTQARFN